MRRDPLGLLLRMAQTYGDISYVRTGDRHIYLLNHPEDIKDLLVTNAPHFIKSIAVQKMKVFLGEGLLTSEGELHDRQRRLIQPAFHAQRIAALAGVMVAEAERVGSSWQEGQTLDIAAEMRRLTMRIVAKALFGADLDAEADELGAALTTLLEGFRLMLAPFGERLLRLPLPRHRRFRDAGERLHQAVSRILNCPRAPTRPSGNLLDLLMKSLTASDPAERMTERQVRDEVMTLFIAGHETTANALAWTWYLLSQHPPAEARLHAELDAAVGDGLPDAATIPKLVYAGQVLNESLRLYPPAWVIGRQALDDYPVRGYVIPRGSIVFASPWAMHHDPRYYPDPFKFDPDRWTPEARAQRPRFAFFPFGAGPRVCIGENFAWTEAILVLATLARRWKPRLLPGQRIVPQPLVTLRPKNGIRVILERRNNREPL